MISVLNKGRNGEYKKGNCQLDKGINKGGGYELDILVFDNDFILTHYCHDDFDKQKRLGFSIADPSVVFRSEKQHEDGIQLLF